MKQVISGKGQGIVRLKLFHSISNSGKMPHKDMLDEQQ